MPSLRYSFKPPAIGENSDSLTVATIVVVVSISPTYSTRVRTTPKCARFPANLVSPEFYLGEPELFASDSKDVITLTHFSGFCPFYETVAFCPKASHAFESHTFPEVHPTDRTDIWEHVMSFKVLAI